MEKWDTLDSAYLFTSPFGNVRRDTVRLPNGKVLDTYIVNEYPEWVNVVALTVDREAVFVRQYRHGSGDFFIEIPGGMVHPGESPEKTAVRELREETGYISSKPPILIGDYYTNPAVATNRIKSYLILEAERQSEPHPDDTEDLECLLIPFSAVSRLIEAGEIIQMFTVSAYCFAWKYLRLLEG